MANFRYIRKSKDSIDEQNQIHITDKYALDNQFAYDDTIIETITGNSNHDDRELGRLIEKLKPRDRLVMADVSRAGRKTLDVMEAGSKIMKRKARLIFVENGLELSDDVGSEVTFFALSLGARIYREMVSQKTKTGLANAAAHGRKGGKPKGSFTKAIQGKEAEIKAYKQKGLSDTAIAKIYAVHRVTIAKFLLANP